MSRTLEQQVRDRLAKLATPEAGAAGLGEALRLLAKWRSHHIQSTLLRATGTEVLSGIFKGMTFLPHSAEGCHIPKLLGTYEQPLHAEIESAVARGYPLVINIGCAEGYYAVGLARRMPASRVLAFDLNPAARKTCAELAKANGVDSRIEIGSEFRVQDFARYAGSRVLIVCDIEGAEKELLDPGRAPALSGMDLIVEAHDCIHKGLSAELAQRFAATHEVRLIRDVGNRQMNRVPEWFAALSHLDQLLAVWEWRSGPTPWLVLTSRQAR